MTAARLVNDRVLGPRGFPAKTGVAAFDFDQTLVPFHSLRRFALRTCGFPRVATAAVVAALRVRSADALKIAMLRSLFRGMSASTYESMGYEFALECGRSLRSTMLQRLEWHKRSGHATLIVSAALEVYLRPVAEQWGVDAALGVEIERDSADVLTGEILGGFNNRGVEKVRRIEGWLISQKLSRAEVELWAYGDGPGDRQMLEAADHGVFVH